MATTTVVARMSVEQYLTSSFKPDMDFVDGLLEERNMGEWEHGRLQGILFAIFLRSEKAWNIWVSVDSRVQTSSTSFRVPDVCVTDGRYPTESIATRPPLLCIEIVSPEDRLRKVLERLADYDRMGVAACWVFDPETRKVWTSRRGTVDEWTGGTLTVSGTAIEVDPREVFNRAFQQG